MTEAFNFSEAKKPKNPEMEKFIENIFLRNPKAKGKKYVLLDLLNSDSFDESRFRNEINQWEEAVKQDRGLKGQSSEIEKISGKHGKLKVYYFSDSDSVKFGFDFY